MSSAEFMTLLAGTAGAFTALLFARAAWHKLADFTEFTGFVADYQLVPEPMVRPVSWSLIGRNIAIAALVASALFAPITLNLEGAIAAIGAGFTLWLGFIAVEQLLANAARFSLKR